MTVPSPHLMVVTCVSWFDEPLNWDRVTAAVADRLVPAFPRFAQRVVDPPVTLGLVGPRWADVPGFDVGDHLRRVLLPATGGDDELHAQVSARADRPPDSARPLWRADLIDGYRTGCAVLLRTHHAIADGTALVQVPLALADRPADSAPGLVGWPRIHRDYGGQPLHALAVGVQVAAQGAGHGGQRDVIDGGVVCPAGPLDLLERHRG